MTAVSGEDTHALVTFTRHVEEKDVAQSESTQLFLPLYALQVLSRTPPSKELLTETLDSATVVHILGNLCAALSSVHRAPALSPLEARTGTALVAGAAMRVVARWQSCAPDSSLTQELLHRLMTVHVVLKRMRLANLNSLNTQTALRMFRPTELERAGQVLPVLPFRPFCSPCSPLGAWLSRCYTSTCERTATQKCTNFEPTWTPACRRSTRIGNARGALGRKRKHRGKNHASLQPLCCFLTSADHKAAQLARGPASAGGASN